MSDYCIENDLARQQEEACIARELKAREKLDLQLSFQFVNCAMENLFKNAREMYDHRVGNQTLQQSRYRLIYTRSQFDDVVESLRILKEKIDALHNLT